MSDIGTSIPYLSGTGTRARRWSCGPGSPQDLVARAPARPAVRNGPEPGPGDGSPERSRA
ncbi:hypothetical protein YUWDRAFT_01949 [Streptomyces sp. AmelKG-D3]|nr:hypothetical protein YUWDRAFT_01949 [Streptomyces sp. AmelKG-D3]